MAFAHKGFLLSGIVAAALIAGAPAFAATVQDGAHEASGALPVDSNSCTLTGMAYSESTDLQKTGSRHYKDVTGTSVSFTQGMTSCVEVSFSAEAATTPGEILITQVLLDDSTPCEPGDNEFASDSPTNDLADHAMNYICPAVAAGAHSVKVQFRSRYGSTVALDYRTTVVQFAK